MTYNGTQMTLTAALASIYTSLTSLPTDSGIDGKISAAIDGLIGGAPETYDTLKEIADYIAEHQDVADALSAAVGGKVDKVEGMGLSANDFTDALKAKLDAMEPVTAAEKAAWDAKAGTAVASTTANGLMSKEDKARLDGLRGVRPGNSERAGAALFAKDGGPHPSLGGTTPAAFAQMTAPTRAARRI